MILGIDLGTSNSLAAIYKKGQVHLIDNGMGGFTTPSVVAVNENGLFYTGEVAKEKSLHNSKDTADRFKRTMGTDKVYKIGNMVMNSEQLSAVILKKIKEDAYRFLGEEVNDAIISVPAFFSNPQREAVLRAGKIAGLNVKKIINEPTAAAMAYGLQNIDDDERAIIVLDLGGGTFDISIMEVVGTVMEVVAICGDNQLGGSDFTDILVTEFISRNNIQKELSRDEYTMLWKAAEKAKISISDNGNAKMKCTIDNNTYILNINEDEYEKMCFKLLEKIRKLTIRAIDESKYMPHEISDIILVGGGTKLSIVKKMMEKMIDKELKYHINPDEAVVRGAAMQGALLERNEDLKNFIMTDICPYYIIEKANRWIGDDIAWKPKIMINKNTVIPTKVTRDINERWGPSNISIYQAEDVYGINSTLIGECNYVVPETATDKTRIIQNIMYDNNGILRFEVYVPETDRTFRTTIASNGASVDMNEADDSFDKLSQLKISSGEDEINALLIAKAENLYTELTEKDRNYMSYAISDFEKSVATGKKSIVKEARKKLEDVISQYSYEI